MCQISNASMFCLWFTIFYFCLDANKEKELRSTLKSEMQRLVSQDDLLILDAGNYIKGNKTVIFKWIENMLLTTIILIRISIWTLLHC